MNTENLVITQARLASLIGRLGYPNPDDDTPLWKQPHGPGPVARSWLDYLNRVALNPQPLPPGERFAVALAGAFVERSLQVSELGTLFADKQRTLSTSFAERLDEAGDWCGTMSRWEMLQKILAWLRNHNPPPPPGDPWWKQGLTQNEIIIVGGRIAFAAENFGQQTIRASLQEVGGRLMLQGIKVGQETTDRHTVPAAEQV